MMVLVRTWVTWVELDGSKIVTSNCRRLSSILFSSSTLIIYVDNLRQPGGCHLVCQYKAGARLPRALDSVVQACDP